MTATAVPLYDGYMEWPTTDFWSSISPLSKTEVDSYLGTQSLYIAAEPVSGVTAPVYQDCLLPGMKMAVRFAAKASDADQVKVYDGGALVLSTTCVGDDWQTFEVPPFVAETARLSFLIGSVEAYLDAVECDVDFDRVSRAQSHVENQFQNVETGDGVISFSDFIGALLYPVNTIDLSLAGLLNRRSLTTGVGYWLDVLGRVVGVERDLLETPLDELFEIGDVYTYPGGFAADTSRGFADTTQTDGGMLRGVDGLQDESGDTVRDPDFIRIIRAKAAAMFSASSIKTCVDFIYNAFDVDSWIEVDSNGDWLAHLAGELTSNGRKYLEQFAPVPIGVKFMIASWAE